MKQNTVYHYSICYILNFIPGISTMLLLFIIVVVSPSRESNFFVYVFFIGLLSIYGFLVVYEKNRVAYKIAIGEEGILAKRLLSDKAFIKWGDIDKLQFTGKGLFLVSGKLEKYLYGEVVSVDNKKIIFRREINNYHQLIKSIENYSGKLLKPAV